MTEYTNTVIDRHGKEHEFVIEADENRVYEVMYHCFGDNWDEWFETEKEARQCISDQIKYGERNLRIYVDVFFTKEDYDEGVPYEWGIYFLGDFPE